MHVTKWKKPIWKDCMSPIIWHSGKSKTIQTVSKKKKKISDCQGLGVREGWTGRARRILRAVKISGMIPQWWIHVTIHLSKPIESTIPRGNPNVQYGHWVITLCRCRFVNCNKCTTLLAGEGHLIMAEAMHVWRQGVYRKSFTSS